MEGSDSWLIWIYITFNYHYHYAQTSLVMFSLPSLCWWWCCEEGGVGLWLCWIQSDHQRHQREAGRKGELPCPECLDMRRLFSKTPHSTAQYSTVDSISISAPQQYNQSWWFDKVWQVWHIQTDQRRRTREKYGQPVRDRLQFSILA